MTKIRLPTIILLSLTFSIFAIKYKRKEQTTAGKITKTKKAKTLKPPTKAYPKPGIRVRGKIAPTTKPNVV